MKIIISQQHGLDDRWIDIVNMIEKECANRVQVEKYYVFVSQKKQMDRIRKNMPNDKTEVIYIYEKWKKGKVGESEIVKLRNWESNIKDPEMNLWRFLMPDIERGIFNMSENDYYWALYWHFDYYDMFFKENQIDAMIGFVPENLPNCALYSIAKTKNIKCIFLEISRIWNHVYFFDNYLFNKEKVKDNYLKLLDHKLTTDEREKAEKLRTFIVPDKPLDYISEKINKYDRNDTWLSQVIDIAKLFYLLPKIYLMNLREGEPYYKLDIAELFRPIKRRNRKIIIEKNGGGIFTRPEKEGYFYFPLHYQPEITTSLLAPHYINQVEVIRQIAISLPINCKLYVKEHPSMADVGYRPISFYKSISNIKNVRLIQTRYNSRELIIDSKGIITLSGTSALEAMILGKPAVIFADVFFADIPGLSWRVKGFMELYNILNQALIFKPDEERIIKFLAAISRVTCSGINLMQKFQLEEEDYINNYRRLAKILTDKILESVER